VRCWSVVESGEEVIGGRDGVWCGAGARILMSAIDEAIGPLLECDVEKREKMDVQYRRKMK
jgi:hypothetical protein